MCSIPLDKGKVAIVDQDDYQMLSGYRWYAVPMGRNWYAMTSTSGSHVLMHRMLLGLTDPAQTTDHANGDGLDNRRSNLRTCSHRENMWNCRMPVSNSSGFKGVHLHRLTGRWRAQIRNDGSSRSLGLFDSPEAAARAYDRAAFAARGQFARLNLVAGEVL